MGKASEAGVSNPGGSTTGGDKKLASIDNIYLYRVGFEQNAGTVTFEKITKVGVQDTITPDYNIEYDLYGKNEPIVTYKNTKRTIKLNFNINANVSSTINKYNQLLYPVYNSDKVVTGVPMFRIKWSSILCKPGSDPRNNNVIDNGLLCVIKSTSIIPNYLPGHVFFPLNPFNPGDISDFTRFSTAKVDMDIVPFSEIDLGWSNDKQPRNADFFKFPLTSGPPKKD